ncbi:PadR family transcriptional regulator [Halonotius aquaticus]|jgi:DNA-binding PadR family transcriptional regulator|uniref:PadR family transcriptional regulator n=1 Tax=Halonotius aquaticus TaxID=2216978 RepID=A0A3A6PXB7_9EURY|nr:PadR family transcriptional regulator [Halonotius aquaticus]RJX42906.1 PadR family transcriptional regulator [Halonotius aquaticus]
MFELTGFQRDLLYCIAGAEEPYGLGIKAELEAYGDTEVNHGRLYPNLDTLIEKGYVTKSQLDDRTNRYELTDAGREVLAGRREWEAKKLSGVLDS